MPLKESMQDINKQVEHIVLPDVDLGFHQRYGVNISDIANRFFDLTRYGTNFKPVNVTLFDWEPYAQSMAIYAAMAGIVAAGLSIFLIVFCCCNCMFRSAAPRTYKSKNQRNSGRGSAFFCGIFVFVVAILGAATFVVGFIGEVRLHNGANDACTTIDMLDDKARLIHNDTQNIENELNNAIILVKDLEKPIEEAIDTVNSLPSSDTVDNIKNTLNSIQSQYGSILEQVNEANKTISEKIQQTKILDQVMEYLEPVQEKCPEIVGYLRLGALLVLIILAISSLLFILGLCNNCIRSFTTLVGYIMFNILIVFGIVAFLALIVGSDFCQESKPLIRYHVPVDNEIKTTVLDYYLYCNQTSAIMSASHHHIQKRDIPFFDISAIANVPTLPDFSNTTNIGDIFESVQDFIDQAKNYTSQFNGTLQQLETIIPLVCPAALHQSAPQKTPKEIEDMCNQLKDQVSTITDILVGTGPNPNSLLDKMEKVASSVGSIVSSVDCNSINPEINHTLSNVCGTIYEAFFFFLINSAAAVLCFYLLLTFSIWMLFP